MSEWLISKRTQTTNVGEDAKKMELSYIVSGSVNCSIACRKQHACRILLSHKHNAIFPFAEHG